MVVLKVLLAVIPWLLNEAIQRSTCLLLRHGSDELLFQRFRSAVKSAYRGCTALSVPALLQSLRELKHELLALEAMYEEVHRRVPADLLDCEHLRYCDERELIARAVDCTNLFAARLLVLAFESDMPDSCWASREVLAARLPKIWESWYYRKLPIELRSALLDDELHYEDSQRILKANGNIWAEECKGENRW